MKLKTMRLPAAAFVLSLLLAIPAVRAISVIPPTFPDLVGNADTIFSGKVIDREAKWVTNTAGHRVIKTYVTVRIDELAKGEADNKVVLEFLGGTVKGHTMRIGGMPRFHKGQRAWFFVRDNGKVLCPLAYAHHGAYLLVAAPDGSGDRVLRLNGSPLTSEQTVGVGSDAPAQMNTRDLGSRLQRAMPAEHFFQAITREVLTGKNREAQPR